MNDHIILWSCLHSVDTRTFKVNSPNIVLRTSYCTYHLTVVAGARERYIDLSEAQQKKLKQLTLCSLAGEKKILSYQSLQKELKIDNLRNLEDLIIDTIYLVSVLLFILLPY